LLGSSAIFGRMTGSSPGYQRFLAELKRRRVFRVIAAYGIVGFGIIEAAELLAQGMGLADGMLHA